MFWLLLEAGETLRLEDQAHSRHLGLRGIAHGGESRLDSDAPGGSILMDLSGTQEALELHSLTPTMDR